MKTYKLWELEQVKVINPAFIPTAKDYARAILAREKAEKMEVRIRTDKPFLWALCLQHTRNGWEDAWADIEEIQKEIDKLKKKEKQ